MILLNHLKLGQTIEEYMEEELDENDSRNKDKVKEKKRLIKTLQNAIYKWWQGNWHPLLCSRLKLKGLGNYGVPSSTNFDAIGVHHD